MDLPENAPAANPIQNEAPIPNFNVNIRINLTQKCLLVNVLKKCNRKTKQIKLSSEENEALIKVLVKLTDKTL